MVIWAAQSRSRVLLLCVVYLLHTSNHKRNSIRPGHQANNSVRYAYVNSEEECHVWIMILMPLLWRMSKSFSQKRRAMTGRRPRMTVTMCTKAVCTVHASLTHTHPITGLSGVALFPDRMHTVVSLSCVYKIFHWFQLFVEFVNYGNEYDVLCVCVREKVLRSTSVHCAQCRLWEGLMVTSAQALTKFEKRTLGAGWLWFDCVFFLHEHGLNWMKKSSEQARIAVFACQ